MSKKNSCRHVIRIEYDNKVKLVKLKNTVYSIGRSPSNSIVIDYPKVSREHCIIVPAMDEFENNGIIYYIVDGNVNGKPSSNGLFVDLKTWTLKHRLRTGDVIGIGTRQVALSYYKFSLHQSANCHKSSPLSKNHQYPSKSRIENRLRRQIKTPEIIRGKDFILLN